MPGLNGMVVWNEKQRPWPSAQGPQSPATSLIAVWLWAASVLVLTPAHQGTVCPEPSCSSHGRAGTARHGQQTRRPESPLPSLSSCYWVVSRVDPLPPARPHLGQLQFAISETSVVGTEWVSEPFLEPLSPCSDPPPTGPCPSQPQLPRHPTPHSTLAGEGGVSCSLPLGLGDQNLSGLGHLLKDARVG